MEGQPITLDQTLRIIRILHGVFLFTMVLYAYVAHISTPPPAIVNPSFFWSIVGVALGCYFASLLVTARKISPAIEKLRTNPDDRAALVSWRVGAILSYVTMECVPLFGFAQYFLGATVRQVAPFFCGAVCNDALLISKTALTEICVWMMNRTELFVFGT
jgi:hypothetical protein